MVAVITGVSSGIGKEICKRLLDKGWIVIGLSRRGGELGAIEYEDCMVDIADSRALSFATQNIQMRHKTIDLLVNCVGIFKQAPFAECSSDDIIKIITTNLIGTMLVTYNFLPILKGRIINIASVSALHGIKNQAIYSASKAGMKAFAESLGQEGHNITTIYPGGVDTPLWNEKNPYLGEDFDSLLKTWHVAQVVEFIANAPLRVVIKKIVMFPESESH